MKRILSLILFFCFIVNLKGADSDWKLHPIFDEEVTHIIDTPDYVYFTSRNMALNEWNDVFLSLFRYDKKGDEIISLSPSNILNGYNIREIAYNKDKRYLVVLYKDYNIDLLQDDGKVYNIPYYKNATPDYDKKVNSITFDPSNDRIYFATDFGYLAINDKKREIAESRNYDNAFNSFCRLDDTYYAIVGETLMMCPVNSKGYNLENFTTLCEVNSSSIFYTLSHEVSLLIEGEDRNKSIKKIQNVKGDFNIETLLEGEVYNIDYTPSGLNLVTDKYLYQFNSDGSFLYMERPMEFRNTAASSNNMRDIWNGKLRKGINCVRKNSDQWTLVKDYMLPNSPSTYASVSYAQHPDKGLLVLNYGYNPQTVGLCEAIPFELSSYKNGRWANHSMAYTNPDRTYMMLMTNGLAVDPDNNKYIYITSCHNGIARLNLIDPKDIIHMSRSNDPDSGRQGFVSLVKASDYLPMFANFSSPCFDAKGNMWMNYADWDDRTNPNPHLYCWTAEDRKNTISAIDIKLPQLVEVDIEVPVSNTAFVLPLLKTGTGLLLFANSKYDERLMVIDTNGTPLDNSDDRIYDFPYFRDSDGNNIEIRNIRYLWEDMATGLVWVCHLNGVCHFDPREVLNGKYELHRVKVSRNDGTNLADYLLDGVTVNQLVEDSERRKWFALAGGGLICTTSDGSEIIEEFNTDNSPLPDNIVYGVGYDSDSNSLMISTAQGFAEYLLPLNYGSSAKSDIRVYPNPVRPDYTGYVTITDVPQDSLVKITDVAGNLVKELGVMTGFEMLWDISDSRFNRVKSGVYYIMTSPSYEGGSYSRVGKILVVS